MVRDLARSVLAAPSRPGLPEGDGGPVVVVPGIAAGDVMMRPLRRFLRRLGHDVRSADLGVVTDDVLRLSDALTDRVVSIADQTGRPVALVGWSIGGLLAREVARFQPASVRTVITFGTPVYGGPSYTVLAPLYDEAKLASIRAMIDERHALRIERPITAIRSVADGIVASEACIDPDAENIAVASTHLGMPFDPTVWKLVAERLGAGPS